MGLTPSGRQGALPLVFEPSFRAEDFVVSACNEEAYRWIMRWPDWPSFGLCLHGPPGSGKSHLAGIWAARVSGAPQQGSGGRVVAMETRIPRPPAAPSREEEALLHLYNACKETGGWLLITSETPLSRYGLRLPDLSSRLGALPQAALRDPDDAALEGVLRKLFADRQLAVSAEVIAFLLPRMERSFAAARRIVARLDAHSLERRRPVSIPLVNEALGALW